MHDRSLAGHVVQLPGPVAQHADVQGDLVSGGVGGEAEGVPLPQGDGWHAEEDVLAAHVLKAAFGPGDAHHIAGQAGNLTLLGVLVACRNRWTRCSGHEGVNHTPPSHCMSHPYCAMRSSTTRVHQR